MNQRRLSPQALAVLGALAADPRGWRHGYDLADEVGLSSGSLYPILMRLDDRGLLESTWEEPGQGRPPRHLYRITRSGASVVEGERRPARAAARRARAVPRLGDA